MREYELTVVYDLAVAEQGGPDASVQLLTGAIEARAGNIIKVDHWGRRRMAYPIGRAIDGDYIVVRVNLEAAAVSPLEESLRINERVYRHLIVRADELPAPPQPREPRRMPQAEAPAAPVAPPAESAPAAEPEPVVVESAPVAVAEAAPEAAEAPVADAEPLAEPTA